MIRPHKPTSRGVLPAKYGSFDCETEGLYGETRLVCLVLNNGEKYVFKGRKASEEFVAFVTTRKFRGYHLYAHNLSFDLEKTFGAVYGNSIDNKKLKVIMAGTRLIKAVYSISEKNKLTLLDTFNLVPMKLADIGEDLGFPKLPTPNKWITGDEVTEITKEDEEYCFRDCEIVLKILEHFKTVLSPFKISLKVTIASNAKAVWKSIYLPKDHLWMDEERDEVFRRSYYGGRTEVFFRAYRKKNLYYYDINSMYPHAMLSTKFPNPDKLKYSKNLTEALKTNEGCAKITVSAPKDLKYPVLPYRTDKLIFPIGKFTGVYNFPEIRLAIEKGYKIDETHWVLSSEPLENPFKAYIDYFMKLKIKSKESGEKALTSTAKSFMNSLYGKFAQRIDIEDRYTHDEPQEGVAYKLVGKNTYKLLTVEKDRAEETVVCWSSYITSVARVMLYSYFPKDDGLVYCDTDSVVRTTKLSDDQIHPTRLGAMSLEDDIVESYFAAPKRYAYKNADGKEIKKVKGIPSTQVQHISIEFFGNDVGIFYTKPVKMRTGINRGVKTFSKEIIKKNLRVSGDKRVFNSDGTSIPITV